jgi:hypothetical protein
MKDRLIFVWSQILRNVTYCEPRVSFLGTSSTNISFGVLNFQLFIKDKAKYFSSGLTVCEILTQCYCEL